MDPLEKLLDEIVSPIIKAVRPIPVAIIIFIFGIAGVIIFAHRIGSYLESMQTKLTILAWALAHPELAVGAMVVLIVVICIIRHELR